MVRGEPGGKFGGGDMRHSERIRLRQRYPDPGDDPAARLRHVVDVHSDVAGQNWAVRATIDIHDATTGLTHADLRALAKLLTKLQAGFQARRQSAPETAAVPGEEAWPAVPAAVRAPGDPDGPDDSDGPGGGSGDTEPIWQVYSYGPGGGRDQRDEGKPASRAEAEQLCRQRVREGRRSAHVMRIYDGVEIVYHFDWTDLGFAGLVR